MNEKRTGLAGRALPAALAVVLLLVGGVGGWLWGSWQSSGKPTQLAAGDRAAVEGVVHDYILAHPEILPQAMENLQNSENAKQLAAVRNEVETPFPGAVLGNPDGKVTLVEFTDFACGYCRQSVADVEALVAQNPDLRVIIREFPILTPESADAARMALAAAEQGKYSAFHHDMFAAGHPGPETIAAAARAAGVNLAQAKAAAKDPRIEAEIQRNFAIGRQLGFNGTPSWVIGDQILTGAIGKDQLAKAIDKAREG
jgi:protein-disulfide isomerase